MWVDSWETGTYHLGQQRQSTQACASTQSRRSNRCLLSLMWKGPYHLGEQRSGWACASTSLFRAPAARSYVKRVPIISASNQSPGQPVHPQSRRGIRCSLAMFKGHLSSRRAAKVRARLQIRTDSPGNPVLARSHVKKYLSSRRALWVRASLRIRTGSQGQALLDRFHVKRAPIIWRSSVSPAHPHSLARASVARSLSRKEDIYHLGE